VGRANLVAARAGLDPVPARPHDPAAGLGDRRAGAGAGLGRADAVACDWAQGAEWTLFLLFLVWAADTGAFIAGKALGRHKLAPRVSPGKTWEGAAGGLVLGGLFAWLAAGWFVQPVVSFVAVSLVVVIFSIIGDLTESMLKRYAGLKDSGQLIPGHGGIMDRMDSITAAAPVLMLGLGLLR